MLSHFTLKTHQMALIPIKSLVSTGVAIIKSDLPIIFLIFLLILSPQRTAAGPSEPQRMDKEWVMVFQAEIHGPKTHCLPLLLSVFSSSSPFLRGIPSNSSFGLICFFWIFIDMLILRQDLAYMFGNIVLHEKRRGLSIKEGYCMFIKPILFE